MHVGVGVGGWAGGWVYTWWCLLVLLRCSYVCVPEQALTKEFKEKVSKGKCCVM